MVGLIIGFGAPKFEFGLREADFEVFDQFFVMYVSKSVQEHVI
jgi:hypothetical protein